MNKHDSKKTDHLTKMGLLLALSLIFSYIEFIIPFNFTVPGMKLGLANLAVVLTLYLFGERDAFLIDVLRVILSGFLFGNLAGILFSLAGAVLSFAAMVVARKLKIFSICGVSICGGIFHNIGQIIIAMFVVKTMGIIYYLPVLLITGVITGALIGISSAAVLKYKIKDTNRS